MDIPRKLLAVPLCALMTCCTLQQKADTRQNENAKKSNQTSADSLLEQFGDKQLLDQLTREQGIEKPFAWWGWPTKKENSGTIVGIDQKGLLRKVYFVKSADAYIIKPSEVVHEPNIPIRQSGDLDLQKYLPDTEFPFRSFIISSNSCKVHFILLWKAMNRSFEQRRAVFLDAIALRIMVERDGAIVANELKELLFENLDKTIAEDINMDGRPDFLVVGSNRITFVRAWTVSEDCAFSPILFKYDDQLFESVRDKELFIRKNKKTNTYDVHVLHYEPLPRGGRFSWEVMETVYRWDSIQSVYRVSETNTHVE